MSRARRVLTSLRAALLALVSGVPVSSQSALSEKFDGTTPAASLS